MLIADPPYSYTEISAKLGIPAGGIGAQRARCPGTAAHLQRVQEDLHRRRTT